MSIEPTEWQLSVTAHLLGISVDEARVTITHDTEIHDLTEEIFKP